MDIVEIVKVDNSRSFVLPYAVLARWKLCAGDIVQPDETPEGLLLAPGPAAACTR